MPRNKQVSEFKMHEKTRLPFPGAGLADMVRMEDHPGYRAELSVEFDSYIVTDEATGDEYLFDRKAVAWAVSRKPRPKPMIVVEPPPDAIDMNGKPTAPPRVAGGEK